MALPTLVCLKSANNKYLRYSHEDDQTRGLLQFSAESVMDPYAQFEVEKAKTWDGLVHIKSRYTNKYLVRWSPNHELISATAYAPNEDQSSWGCTLFKPIPTDGDSGDHIIQLLHVQLGRYACLWTGDASFDSCLSVGSNDPGEDSTYSFIVIDWESLFRLPNRVAFKNRDNGLFLGAKELSNGLPGLQFSYENPNDPEVAQEIFPLPDGTIYIKSTYYGKFWRYGQDLIVADADDPRGTDDVGAMFRLSVLDLNLIALMNMSPTAFCKRYTVVGRTSFLNANIKVIDRFTPLEVTNLEN